MTKPLLRFFWGRNMNEELTQSEKIRFIEGLLDLNFELTDDDYISWDRGDCSLIGILIILLKQEIRKLDSLHYDYIAKNSLLEFIEDMEIDMENWAKRYNLKLF